MMSNYISIIEIKNTTHKLHNNIYNSTLNTCCGEERCRDKEGEKREEKEGERKREEKEGERGYLREETHWESVRYCYGCVINTIY